MTNVRLKLPAVRQYLQEQVWAITPGKLEAMLEVVELHAAGGSLTADQIRERIGAVARPVSRVQGAVKILPLHGIVAPKMNLMVQYSGGTSCEQFAEEFDAAVRDPAIGAIVIPVTSPGGSVQGTVELARRMHAARGTKQIIAVVEGEMCSAAYWIGSAADQIFAAPSAEAIGSIGVLTVRTDLSAIDAAMGVKRTLVAEPAFKGEGLPFLPMTAAEEEATRAKVADFYGLFVGDVAKFRGVSEDVVRTQYGMGRTFTARQALAAGMIDRIATLEEVVGELAAGTATSPRARGARAEVHFEVIGASASDPGFDQFTAGVLARVKQGLGIESLAAVETDGEGADPCPDCGAPLEEDESGYVRCTTCDYVRPAAAPPASSSPESEANARGGAPSLEAPTPTNPPAHQARSLTMPDMDTAAQRAAQEAEIRAAETHRQNEIRTLCADHSIADAQRDEWLNAGTSVEHVSAAILRAGRAAAAAGTPAITVGEDRDTRKPWESLGHFAAAVVAAGMPNGRAVVDPRLLAGATGLGQQDGSNGGFTVPGQFGAGLWMGILDDPNSLLGLCDQYQVEGEFLEMPAVDETSRAAANGVYGGVNAYWLNEADQATKSKPKFRKMRLEPQEIAALVYLTEKLLNNSPLALGSYIDRMARGAISFEVNKAIMNGDGVGKPKGLLKSGCKVSVAKETNQAAATIVQENISKAWARMPAGVRSRAVWLHNVDIEPQLDALSTTVKNVAGTENVGGYANKVFDAERRTLKGRPLIANDACETLGTEGDLILIDPLCYAIGLRRAGIKTAQSMHVRFEYAEMAFRFMFDVDGQSWLTSALTPYKGANALSPIITLATR